MTSSDLTLLPDDAKERAAARVGTRIDGRPSVAASGARRRPGRHWPVPSSTGASPTGC